MSGVSHKFHDGLLFNNICTTSNRSSRCGEIIVRRLQISKESKLAWYAFEAAAHERIPVKTSSLINVRSTEEYSLVSGTLMFF